MTSTVHSTGRASPFVLTYVAGIIPKSENLELKICARTLRSSLAAMSGVFSRGTDKTIMAIELSIPLLHSSYLRTFAAEIDVLADNELLVRGSMRDHRFAFEHVWRLRTPEYEITE